MSKMTIKVHEASTSNKLDDVMYNAFASYIGPDRAIKLSGDCGEYDITLYDLEGNVIGSDSTRDVLTAATLYDRLCKLIDRKTGLQGIPTSFKY